MKNKRSKFRVGVLVVLLSMGTPVLMQLIFSVIFADYYKNGFFLPGFGHYMVTALMIIVNLIAAPMIVFLNYPSLEQEDLGNILLTRITIIFAVSIVVQIVLSIMIENPFSPSTPNF